MLAIETTGAFASVAVRDSHGNVYADGLNERLNHLKGLLPLLDKLLEKADLSINDIGTIAVSQGPGSFTGIRIGISTVRALAQITGAKVIGVPTLETFVYNLPEYRGVVCPIFDARMEQMYAGAFMLDNNKIQTLIETGAYNSNEFLNRLTELIEGADGRLKHQEEIRFFGDGLKVFHTAIENWAKDMHTKTLGKFNYEIVDANVLQRATSVLLWAENFGRRTDYKELFPTYVRKAEAQRRLDEQSK
jgi:tRNA threonylcarbamoyladenosine biosynthesis protein TsaB